METDGIVVTIESPEEYIDFVVDLGRRTAMVNVSVQRSATCEEAETSYLRMIDYVFKQESMLFIAKADNIPAGFLLFVDFLPDEVTSHPQGFVAYMAVEDAMRRKGIAKKLLTAVEEHARAKGLPAIALMVTESNTPALSVYEQHGYSLERRLMCKVL